MMVQASSRPTAPSGDLLVTVEVVNADGASMLLRTSGRSIEAAVFHALTEAAEQTERVADLTPDDEEYDTQLATAIDDTQRSRAWYGHHATVPKTQPDFEE